MPPITMQNAPFNLLEQEIVVLAAVWDMISGLVNNNNFTQEFLPHGELHFKSCEHQILFSILLVDFLSLPQEGLFDLPRPSGAQKHLDSTFLYLLLAICKDPQLGEAHKELVDAVSAFDDWLKAETVVQNVWLPSVNVQVELNVRRILILRTSGNASKHGFARLGYDVGLTEKLLKDHGHQITEGQSFLAHTELSNWFINEGPLNYLAPVAAEHLNNIRWAIYGYLKPVFARYAYTEDGRHFKYKYPEDCTAVLAKEYYWELMNSIIRKPYFPRFTIGEIHRRIF